MALIEVYHVIADSLQVNSSATIIEGQLVSLSTVDGTVILASGVSNGSSTRVIGIAGDTKSTTTSGSVADTNDANLGVNGTDTPFVNRVSDSFDETKASGQITVYHAGGRFKSNQYDTTTQTWTPGAPLYSGPTGLFTTFAPTSGNDLPVATLIAGPTVADSGVPGLDATVDNNGLATNSITLGTFIEFILNV